MTENLPPLIDRFVAAVNRGNTEAFLACFAADGVVDCGLIREMRITAA